MNPHKLMKFSIQVVLVDPKPQPKVHIDVGLVKIQAVYLQIQPLIQLSMAAEQAEQLQQQEEAAAALHQQQHTTPVTAPQTPIVSVVFYLQLKLFYVFPWF